MRTSVSCGSSPSLRRNWVAQMCATATTDRATGDPGQPGVRIRLYADLRQALPLDPPRP
ncbi:DUF6207 family protein [Streptomyces sp. R41]|uniref:DUF6207 family protein n=1 Tax=Streptomyces sp. R41 TaxID=3238632 RepID=A0AB39R9W6_9ACTN